MPSLRAMGNRLAASDLVDSGASHPMRAAFRQVHLAAPRVHRQGQGRAAATRPLAVKSKHAVHRFAKETC
jgi:hypothetical protein